MSGMFVRTVEVVFNGLLIRGYVPTWLGKAFGIEIRWTLTPFEGRWIINDSTVCEEFPITREGVDAFGEEGNYRLSLVRKGWRQRNEEWTVRIFTDGGFGKKWEQMVFPDGKVSEPHNLSEDLSDYSPEELMPLD